MQPPWILIIFPSKPSTKRQNFSLQFHVTTGFTCNRFPLCSPPTLSLLQMVVSFCKTASQRLVCSRSFLLSSRDQVQGWRRPQTLIKTGVQENKTGRHISAQLCFWKGRPVLWGAVADWIEGCWLFKVASAQWLERWFEFWRKSVCWIVFFFGGFCGV